MRWRLAAWLEPTDLARLLERTRINPYWWVVILCVLFVIPAIAIRGAHYEEGTAIAVARNLFENGVWPEQFRYGHRFPEQPHGVSWLLGVIGLLTGAMPVWLARIPNAIGLLGGASLIFWLVRRYASAVAALVAVVCFIASPMLLQKTVTAESDGVLSVTLFAAFVVFWRGYETGGPTPPRWLAVTAILSAASLIKGPQPLGYFFLGVGAFLTLRQQWTKIIALILVGVAAAAVMASWYFAIYRPGDFAEWADHSRLGTPVTLVHWASWSIRFCFYVAIELLPGMLLFAPLAWRVVVGRGASTQDDLVLALLFYAGLCTLVLAMWPGANGRYAMPAALAVATGAGLAYDRFAAQRPLLSQATVVLAACLVAYRLILNWVVMPITPNTFRQEAIAGGEIAALTKSAGLLLVAPYAADHNLLAYVPHSVRWTPLNQLAQTQPPFWVLVMPDELGALRRSHPNADIVTRLSGPVSHPWRLVEVRSK